jgi:nitroreductase
MEFFETIAKRRSTRKFHAKTVPAEVIDKAIDAALLAPNSSNMQPWEFYKVRSPDKKAAIVDACFGQSAARTASEIIVAVARRDTWRRNQQLQIAALKKNPNTPPMVFDYYQKLVPMTYIHGPFSILGLLKRIIMTTIGIFKPVPRGPFSHSATWRVLIKTTALACENLMLALTAQGYASCPMEGFDEKRVKKILGLGRNARVVMIIGAGESDESGIWGEQIRHDRNLFVFEA